MKKIYYAIALFIITGCFGCSDKDEKYVDSDEGEIIRFSGTIQGFENRWFGKELTHPDQLHVYALKDEHVIVAHKLYVPKETGETVELLCMDDSPMRLKESDYVFYSYRGQEESILSGSEGLYVELNPCQTQQKGNDNQHIRENDFLYAEASKDRDNVNFQFKHAFALLEFTLPAGVKSLVVKDSELTEIYSGRGSFSMKSAQWNAWSIYYPCVNLKIEEPIAHDGEKAWMLIIPGHSGQNFDLLVQTNEYRIYKIRKPVPEGGFLAGQKYEIEVDFEAAEEILNPPLQKDGIWQLSTGRDLEWFRDNVNCGAVTLNAALTATVDLEGSKQNPWWPIGIGNLYEGKFDGNGYTIHGLYTDGQLVESGLWAEIISPAQISNLKVAGQLKGRNIISAGGLVAANYGGSVNCCYSKVDIDYQSVARIGGIVGYNEGEVRNCYYAGNMKIDAGELIGGILGHNLGMVENCYNAGTFSLGCVIVGGIGGGNFPEGTVRNCAALCTKWEDIAGTSYNVIGRVLAYNLGESYNHIVYEGVKPGNPVDENVNVQGTTKNRSECLTPATYTQELGWSSEIWGFSENSLPYLKVLKEEEGRVPDFF